MPPRKQPRDRWLRQRPDPRGAGRSSRLERTLVHVHVVILVGFVVATAAPLLWQDGAGAVQVGARLALLGVFAGVAVDLLLRGERLLHLGVLTLALALGVVLESAHLPGDIAPMLAYSAVATSGARLLRLLPFAVGLLGVGATFATVLGLSHADPALLVHVDGVLLGAALAVSIAGFVGSLEEGTRTAERLDEDALARERVLHREQSEQGAVAAAGRVLHDDVLTSLRLVVDGVEQHLDPEAVRDSCLVSARAVRDETTDPGAGGTTAVEPTEDPSLPPSRLPGPATLGEVVDAVASRSPVAAVTEDPDRLGGLDLPPDTADAVSRALGEALRNVERHSGVPDAVLRLTGHDGSVAVDVVDRGRGLPVDADEGFGLRQSVRAPLVGVGGAVDLLPTPGGGTTVRLVLPRTGDPVAVRRWSDRDLARTHRRTTLTSGGSISLVRSVAWPQGLVWTYLGLRYSWASPNVVVMLGVLVLLAAVTVLVARRLEQGPATLPWVVAVSAVLLGAQGLGLWALPPGGMLDYSSWAVGFVAVPVMTMCFFLPRGLGLLVVAPHPVAALVAASVDPGLTLGLPPLGSLNASLLTPLLGVVLGGLLRHTGQQVEREQERLSQAERALARRRAQAEVSTLHLEHTRAVVVPWLEDVARARVDLADPRTAETARTLSWEVRDDLYAPGFFDPVLRRLVTEARRRGASVEVGAGFAPGAADRTTGLLLRELTPRLAAGSKLTVASRGGHVRLALVPPDPDLVARARRLVPSGLTVDADEFRSVLRYEVSPPIWGVVDDRRTG